MTTRRTALGLLLRAGACAATFIGLGLYRLPRALAEKGKRVLGKDTDPATLIYENPKNLDTSELPVTPLDEFGTMGDTEIEIALDDWRLEVDGAVKSPLELSYQELRDLPAVEREVLLICPGVFVNHGRWKGVTLQEIARLAEYDPRATHCTVYGRSRSGQQSQRFAVSDMKNDALILAYAVNGQKLPLQHGYPLRLVAENHMGFEWTKYVFKVHFSHA